MNAATTVIELETAPNPEFAIILMHGLGADANDFVPLVPELHLSNLPGIRFIFPNAPEIPVTANNGYVMRAWYDILSFGGLNRQVDEAGIETSCRTVRALIDAQNARGIPTSKIFLSGFSQGGAMTWSAGLTHPDALAGLIVMSGYLPSQDFIERNFSEMNRAVPAFAAHGVQDEVLPLRLGQAARDYAEARGCKVQWSEWAMPHSVCPEEIAAIRTWLVTRIAALTDHG